MHLMFGEAVKKIDLPSLKEARIMVVPDSFSNDQSLICRARVTAQSSGQIDFPLVPFPITWLEFIQFACPNGAHVDLAWLIDSDAKQIFICGYAHNTNRWVFREIRRDDMFWEDPGELTTFDSRLLSALVNETLAKVRQSCAWADESLPGGGIKSRGVNRSLHRIRRIVRIVPKAERKQYEASHKGPVEWSHRWEVAGHWRRIPEHSIGKSPDGTYGVRGMTWVANHEKGAAAQEAVRKLRLVTEAPT